MTTCHPQTSERRPVKARAAASGGAVKLTNPQSDEWTSSGGAWERANIIRSFVWTQESADEAALFSQFLVRVRRFFRVDFCFIALRQEDGKIVQAGVPEGSLERLPVDFVRRSMELIANSGIPLCWRPPEVKTEYRSMVVSPLSPPVGQPLGFLMLGHSRARYFNNAEKFLIQSLAGEVSWAIRELRSKQNHRKLLSAASLELKSSLNTVLRECALSKKFETAATMTEHNRALSAIEKNTQEALRTIGSFLDSTVDQRGRLSVLSEPIDLVAVVDDALNVCREKAERAGRRLETHYAEDLPRTYVTDPARLRHVLRDVVDHAIGIVAEGPLMTHVRHNSDFIEVNVSVKATPFAGNAAAAAPAVYSHRPGDPLSTRIETVRENLKLLNGHFHFVELPGGGFEIGLCLPKAEQTRTGCGASNFVGEIG